MSVSQVRQDHVMGIAPEYVLLDTSLVYEVSGVLRVKIRSILPLRFVMEEIMIVMELWMKVVYAHLRVSLLQKHAIIETMIAMGR